MKTTNRLFPLLFLGLTLLLTGCGRQVERTAESRLSDLLPELIGPAEQYATRVRGGGSLLRGRAQSVRIEGVGVRVSEELTLDRLLLDLANVEADTSTGRLRSVESVAFTATLGQPNLVRYLAARRLEIPGLRVQLGQSDMLVSARPEPLGLTPVSVSVRGTLTPRAGGSLLDFTPGSARVTVVPVPGPVLRYLGERLNPVLDLTTLRIPVRVRRAEVRQGTLHLSGSVDPEEIMRLSTSVALRGR